MDGRVAYLHLGSSLISVLHALRGQQGFCGPWDILNGAGQARMEVMLADKVVTINIKAR